MNWKECHSQFEGFSCADEDLGPVCQYPHREGSDDMLRILVKTVV